MQNEELKAEQPTEAGMAQNPLLADVLVGGYGEWLSEDDTVRCVDLDGTIVYGKLKRGKTFRGDNDWYVAWDDGEDCVVVEPSLLFRD